MRAKGPLVTAIAFDRSVDEVVRAGCDLAVELDVPLVPVHALPSHPRLAGAELDAARERVRVDLFDWLRPGVDEGVKLMEPVIEPEEPASLVHRVATATDAQLVVTGGGQRSTVHRWLLGSVADRIVRHSMAPVWIARGQTPAVVRRIVCAVDLSPASRLGFIEALRWARIFGASVRVVTVVHPEHGPSIGDRELRSFEDRLAGARRTDMDLLLGAHDTHGLTVDVDVRAGDPATFILDSAHDADLIVIGSTGTERLGPFMIGGTTEKVLRGAWCSVLTVRDADLAREEREIAVRRVAELRAQAIGLIQEGKGAQAEWRLHAALREAPMLAPLHDALASALEAQGRPKEAEEERRMADVIRRALA